jgi:archaemetzincin
VVSTHRLANEYYGLPKDARLFRERTAKQAVHELGHLFGLVHNHQFECVMRSSTYVEELDLKRAAFCEACAGKLVAATRAA